MFLGGFLQPDRSWELENLYTLLHSVLIPYFTAHGSVLMHLLLQNYHSYVENDYFL